MQLVYRWVGGWVTHVDAQHVAPPAGVALEVDHDGGAARGAKDLRLLLASKVVLRNVLVALREDYVWARRIHQQIAVLGADGTVAVAQRLLLERRP